MSFVTRGVFRGPKKKTNIWSFFFYFLFLGLVGLLVTHPPPFLDRVGKEEEEEEREREREKAFLNLLINS